MKTQTKVTAGTIVTICALAVITLSMAQQTGYYLQKYYATPITVTPSSTQSDQYPGTYTWESTPNNGLHPDWSDTSGAGGSAKVIQEYKNHTKVVELNDTSILNDAQVETTISPTSPTLNATDMWLASNGTGNTTLSIPYEYNATFTFDNDIIGTTPQNWTDTSDPGCSATVVPQHTTAGAWDGNVTHNTVVALAQTGGYGNFARVRYDFPVKGTGNNLMIELWECDQTIWGDWPGINVDAYDNTGTWIYTISLHKTMVGARSLVIPSTVIGPYNLNYWHHLRIVLNLLTSTVDVYVDSIPYVIGFPVHPAISDFAYVQITSGHYPTPFTVHFDAFGYNFHPWEQYIQGANLHWKKTTIYNTTQVQFLEGTTTAFGIELNGDNGVYAINGTKLEHVTDWCIEQWKHFRFEFNSTEGTYILYINTTKVDKFNYQNSVTKINRIIVRTLGYGYSSFVDTVDYSWVSKVNVSWYNYTHEYRVQADLQFPVNATFCNVHNLTLEMNISTPTDIMCSEYSIYNWYNNVWSVGTKNIISNITIIDNSTMNPYAKLYIGKATRTTLIDIKVTTLYQFGASFNFTLSGYFYQPFTCQICAECPDCPICDDCTEERLREAYWEGILTALLIAVPIAFAIIAALYFWRRNRGR